MTSINSLKHDHKNARKRTDRSAMLIAESLKRYGAARSIVIDEDNRILAGNGTIEGAKAAGIKNVRIIDAEGGAQQPTAKALMKAMKSLPSGALVLQKMKRSVSH